MTIPDEVPNSLYRPLYSCSFKNVDGKIILSIKVNRPVVNQDNLIVSRTNKKALILIISKSKSRKAKIARQVTFQEALQARNN